MKKTINTTAVSAVLFLLLSIVLWFAIPYCIEDAASATDIGPRAFPRLMCGAMAVLCVLQLILLAIGVQKGKTITIQFSDYAQVILAMVLAVAAVLCAKFINIVAAAVICALLFLAVLRSKDWRYYAAVIITGILLFTLMRFVMKIRF
ncbi:tripartite tricarboxylate transporter TctB family protein [uncultured Dysosmobacter sp.]|uniref:tripartite tricarboxylate transporter TctB family protein n=1 Tax=uncultured Dysosmobacter sp. TaxID=2591384 RepID=UPI00260B253B|nr:tripartite tricarboxylate transporter TctB family protein [uncultured Dysosmobacter sp.]